MSKVTSLGADTGLTVLDSRAEIRAAERSWAVTGVVTWELMLLSKHHFTVKRAKNERHSVERVIDIAYNSIAAAKEREGQLECIVDVRILLYNRSKKS